MFKEKQVLGFIYFLYHFFKDGLEASILSWDNKEQCYRKAQFEWYHNVEHIET